MTEVYGVINQEMAAGTVVVLVLFVLAGAAMLSLFLIRFIKIIKVRKPTIVESLVHIIAMAFMCFWLCVLISGVLSTHKTHSEYLKIWESGAYSVESGTPEELDVYRLPRSRHADGYEVSFWLNGKYFDTEYAFGDDIISESEWAIIKNSKEFEVKYTTDDEGNNVIFSLSVSDN